MSISGDDGVLLVKVNQELEGYISCLERVKIRDGLKHVLAVSRIGNGHIQAAQPWKLVKGTSEEVWAIIHKP